MNNNVNLGKIIDIEENFVTIKIDFAVLNFGNLMNVHVVFEDKNKKIVGEIIKVGVERIVVSVVGEIVNNSFIPGITSKPSFLATTRIITKEELAYILGSPQIDNSSILLGNSAIYNGYRINVGVNDFFSNHFAILGNTGSGNTHAHNVPYIAVFTWRRTA